MLRKLYSFYAIAAFAFFIPFMVVYYLIIVYIPKWTDKQRTVAMLKGNSTFLWIWEKMTGIRQLKEGGEHINPDKAYIFVCNHVNMLDITIMGRHFTHYGKALAKKETGDIPLLGILFKHISIFVDRSNPASRKKSIDLMIKALESGCSIIMAPEGTRNKTGKILAPFHNGAFRVAIAAQVPILPFVLLDLKELQPVGTLQVKPGTVRVKYLPPIPTKGMTEADVELLKAKTIQAITDVLYAEDSYWKNHAVLEA